MEHTILGTVAMLGFDLILFATLALFALHAIETWWSRRKDIGASQQAVAAIDCELHDFPQARSSRSDAQREEPTRRAA